MTDNDKLLNHEVLHMASFFVRSVDYELLEHPAIKGNPKWAKLAKSAHQSLFDLYQVIGAETQADDITGVHKAGARKK